MDNWIGSKDVRSGLSFQVGPSSDEVVTVGWPASGGDRGCAWFYDGHRISNLEDPRPFKYIEFSRLLRLRSWVRDRVLYEEKTLPNLRVWFGRE